MAFIRKLKLNRFSYGVINKISSQDWLNLETYDHNILSSRRVMFAFHIGLESYVRDTN